MEFEVDSLSDPRLGILVSDHIVVAMSNEKKRFLVNKMNIKF